jgi:xanthine dehydrogenase accessory factor
MSTLNVGLPMSNALLDKLLEAVETRQSVALVTVVSASGDYAPNLGRRQLIWLDGSTYADTAPELGRLAEATLKDALNCIESRRSEILSYQQDDGTVELFVEVLHQPATLIVVGAGHVALPLAHLGKMIGFDVVVIDDRPQFANKQRFPMADQVLAEPFIESLRNWPITAQTYIVLVTRGHAYDVDCLLEVLDSPACYIGMIGSKRRVRAVFELLEREKGIDPATFERVYSPIGLDIGAEAPAEIAVAIAAEIINIYRGGRAVSLSDALRANQRLPLHPQRAENIRKQPAS